MTFFEKELRRVVVPNYPDATFVGRACYVKLGKLLRAKIQFVTGNIADRYEALQITILNSRDGTIDSLRLRFNELDWDRGDNYAWTYKDTSWYKYRPDNNDYHKLAEAIVAYLNVFQDTD